MASSTQSELYIFEKNTDAIGVNKGFYYQVIKTLEKWLNNYSDKNNIKIYCETEDDIKSINSDGTLTYSQIKCYASNFSLNSIEIKKTLFNSFSLHAKYKIKCKTFTFETNSGSKDPVLTKWSKDSCLVNPELYNECRKNTFEIIFKEYEDQKVNKLAIMDKKLATLLNNKSKTINKQTEIKLKIEALNTEKKELMATFELAKQTLETEIDAFIKKIKWVFNSMDPTDAINELEVNCIARIKGIKEFKEIPSLAYSRLITEIYKRSKEGAIEERLLDDSTLEMIIKESEDELKKNSDQIILAHISSEVGQIQNKLENVQVVLLNAIKNNILEGEKTLVFEFKTEEEINILKSKELISEIKPLQSNLERKIKEIELNGDDEETIIKYATELRCSYLIYLEELRLRNLNLEYDTLKSLEKKVRHECIVKVSGILENSTFNSKEFWSLIKETLKELVVRQSKLSGIDLDESFVFAQMYQIAAECHLKWRKEKINE